MQRPSVSVQCISDPLSVKTIELPAVFLSPIRPDIVNMVHYNVRKNTRQPHAVKKDAGAQTSAKSWGTGRAVSRIPRVSGGGTHRSGQGAFGNMCRGGRMFAPTKTYRRWHRPVDRKARRYSASSSVAASAVASLVSARGHLIANVPEIPLVVSTADICSVKKTKHALSILKSLNAFDDVKKVVESRKIRAGVGKMRNRRYVQRRGPLLIYETSDDIRLGFRNIRGVDMMSVYRLNLLHLAPGGHVGRFIIWTENAFLQLDRIYGRPGMPSELKVGYHLPRPMMTHTDVARIITAPEILAFCRPKYEEPPTKRIYRVDPFADPAAMEVLNPYAVHDPCFNPALVKPQLSQTEYEAMTPEEQAAFDEQQIKDMTLDEKEVYVRNQETQKLSPLYQQSYIKNLLGVDHS